MNEISTTLYKVNWEYLINNCLNQNFWKNKWKVFEVGHIAFTLTINRIDVEDNKVIFKVATGVWDYEYIYITLSGSHFNTNIFNSSLYGTIKRMLLEHEEDLIKQLDKYEAALELDDEINSARKAQLREEALECLFPEIDADELNDDQEDAIDSYVSRRHHSSYTNSELVLEELEGKHKPEWFGLLALTLGTPQDYTEWLKAQPSVSYADVVEDDYEHTELREMEDWE